MKKKRAHGEVAGNIFKMYLFRFFRDFWLIIPIIIPFYRSHALTGTEIFLVQSVFSLSLLFWEIPSGYFSDILGRKPTLVIGAACLPIGLTIYAVSSTFAAFAIAESILGLGFAMCSGTESALIYDTLLQTKKKRAYHHIESVAEFITRMGSMVAAVLGGICAMSFLLLPFYINIVTGLLMVLTAAMFIEPVRARRSRTNIVRGIISVVGYSFRHPGILSLIILYAAVLTTGLVGVWTYLIALQGVGAPLFLNGLVFALFQACSAFGALFSHALSRTLGVRSSFRVLLFIPVFLLLCGIGVRPWALTFAFLHAFLWGFSMPFFLERINSLITSDVRATVLSTGSMTGRLLFVLVAPMIGLCTDMFGVRLACVSLAFLFLLLFAAAMFAGRKESVWQN